MSGPFKMKGWSPFTQKEPGGKGKVEVTPDKDKEIKPYQFTWGPPKLKATSKSLKKSTSKTKPQWGKTKAEWESEQGSKKKKNILTSFTDFLKSKK